MPDSLLGPPKNSFDGKRRVALGGGALRKRINQSVSPPIDPSEPVPTRKFEFTDAGH